MRFVSASNVFRTSSDAERTENIMGRYGGDNNFRSGDPIVHTWNPPPRPRHDPDYGPARNDPPPPPPPRPRQTFDDARREAKPALPAGQMSPRVGISCVTPYGLLLSLDVTGSMNENPGQIWNRAPLAATESARAYGCKANEVSMGFLTHGDAYTDDVMSVSSIVTCGPQIDEAMLGLKLELNGGGNQVESYDLVLAYLLKHLTLSKNCKRFTVFLVGDEGIPLSIAQDDHNRYVGGPCPHRRTSEVVEVLRKQGVNIHHIMMTNTQTNARHHDQIYRSWSEVLGGPAGIWRLDDPRRIADLMLLILGWEAGRLKEVKAEFEERQRSHTERRFAAENIPRLYEVFEEGRKLFRVQPQQLGEQEDDDVGELPID